METSLKERDPEKYRAQLDRNREWKRRHRNTPRGHMQVLLGAAKINGPSRNLPFEITLEDLMDLWEMQEGLCALSGDPMTTIGGRGRHANPMNASLDRIDPARGYVPGNIWLVTQRANFVKTDLSVPDLLDMCRKILKTQEEF